ncbi:MAG: Ycf51 family protein [Oscillatoriales cyanobacterium C42_A2020_001]|nr:Ycf51 family protein [Leptolyngbyaceae cyanobacterium C42_A2020_001]
MFSTEQLLIDARWAGYVTIAFAVITLLGWLLKWGIRFRLVGITGFMTVLTGGLFALSLGLYIRPTIPDAVRFACVFDMGGTNVVIAVPPTVTETQLQATLKQAALDLYSPGRLSQGTDKLTIRARTILHPEPGVSKLVYLGQVQRSLLSRQDNELAIEIDPTKLAELPQPTA